MVKEFARSQYAGGPTFGPAIFPAGNTTRIRATETVALSYWTNGAPGRLLATIRLVYDDGSEDELNIEITSFTTDRSANTNYPGTDNTSAVTGKKATQDGYVVGVDLQRFG